MISLHEAVQIIRDIRPARAVEPAPLAEALGRVCAQDMTAKLTQPAFSASAMDGYAVLFDDMAVGARLEVVGAAPAGQPFSGSIKSGQAIRIFTGSVVPEGADHVIIQEDVTRDGDYITVEEPQPVARNIRRAGIDFQAGDILLRKGTRLGPAHIALAAASNHAELPVYAPFTVALLANGDELRPPGSTLKAGQIISSNQAALTALLQSWGMRVMDLGIAADDPADIARRLRQAEAADVIVPIGGASVGDHDHMKAVFEAEGYETLFRKVAVRPGKPSWLARRGSQRVLGLPGNPASAFVCAQLFLKILLGLSDDIETRLVPVASDIGSNGPRDHFMRAQIKADSAGKLTATASPQSDSSLITPLAASNALIHRHAGAPAVKAGDVVPIVWLNSALDSL